MNKVTNRKSLTKNEQGDMLVLNLLQFLGPDPDVETFVEMLEEHQLGERVQARQALGRLIKRGSIEVFGQK